MNKKKIFIIVFSFILVGILFLSVSYAIFTKSVPLTSIDFVAGDLSYTLTSDDLIDGNITIPSNSNRSIFIKVKSNNEFETNYKLYYDCLTVLSNVEKNNLDVGYSYLTEDETYGLINSDEEKNMFVQITNNTSKNVELKFGVQGGFKDKELTLKSGNEINKAKYLVDYSGNNYSGKLMNGAKLIYDEDEDMYALRLSGETEYVDIADLPSTIDWENGFTIEFILKLIDDGTTNNKIPLQIGNGISNNEFILYTEQNKFVTKFCGDTCTYSELFNYEYNRVYNLKIEYKKTATGYDVLLYIDGEYIKTVSKDIALNNVDRSENYLGYNNYGSGMNNFNGNIYNLKIIEADGDPILWYAPNMQFNFDYAGKEQSIALPVGEYKLETWGAQGGNATYNHTYVGGYGGYSTGKLELNKVSNLFVYTGGRGVSTTTDASNITYENNGNGYNGGMTEGGTVDNNAAGGGGGATHIATRGELLYRLESYKNDILIVSGGGGGASSHKLSPNWSGNGGYAGGYIGGDSNNLNDKYYQKATGGTQTQGGAAIANPSTCPSCTSEIVGLFGKSSSYARDSGGGGGGGYYGGATGSHSPGAGGSGYVGGVTNGIMYCYDCQEYNEDDYPTWRTVSTTGDDESRDTLKCSSGYSEKPISKCAKAGNGYSRITYIKK